MKFSSAAVIVVVPIWNIFVVVGGAVVSPTHAQPAHLIFSTVVADADPFAACGDYTDWIGAELASAMYPTTTTTTTTSTDEEPERRLLRGVMWPGRVAVSSSSSSNNNNNNNNNNNKTKPICLRSDCADVEDLQDDTGATFPPPRWCYRFCHTFYPGTCQRTFPQCVQRNHNKTKNPPQHRQLEHDTVADVVDEDSLSDWCGSNCRGFQPGTCQLAFPWCGDGMPHRLEQQQQQQQQQQTNDSTVVDKVVDTPKALGEVLPFPSLEPQDPDSLDCVTLQRAVQEKLAELASTIAKDNEACAAALLKQYETLCFRVATDQRP